VKICLVASGGGHLRQLLQVESFFKKHDYYFVTEDTPLGRSVAEQHRVRFVPHFAFGQRKLKSYWYFLFSGIRNFSKALWILLTERPDVVISTGAGGAFSTLFWGSVAFRKVIYIETIARVEKPSLFGSMARNFASFSIVQWPELLATWPSAYFCDTLREYPADGRKKKNQILVTIGTFVPFDRMVQEVDRLCEHKIIDQKVIAQVGPSNYQPRHMEYFNQCSYEKLNALMEESDIVICHGGSGSLLGALKAGCRIVALPRLQEHGEVYDNHQFQIIRALERRGLIEAAYRADEIAPALERVRKKAARRVEVDPDELMRTIEGYLFKSGVQEESLSSSKRPVISHFCHHYPRSGGIERYIQDLCRGMQEKYSQQVLACHDVFRSTSKAIEGTKVMWAGTWLYLFRMSIAPRYPFLMRKIKAGILHFHLPNPLAVISYLVMRPSGKIVVTYHMDVIKQKFLRKIYYPMAELLLRRADCIIVSSPKYAESSDVLRRHRDKCRIIPFGVENKLLEIAENKGSATSIIKQEFGDKIVLYTGRLTYYKGLSVLVEAFKHVEGTLMIVGTGPLENEIKEQIEREGLEKKVHLMGWVEDEQLVQYYQAAKVFVLPSVERTEAFGIVLLEAQAFGVPCVTTELGTGTSYVNVHQKTGLVVPPKDPGALSEAINEILNDQEKWKAMSEAARKNVQERFTEDQMIEKTIAVYREVLQQEK
jgi:rhamnosyl/mannosyltransferase